MAVPFKRACLQAARTVSQPIRPRRHPKTLPPWQTRTRSFSQTPRTLAKDDQAPTSTEDFEDMAPYFNTALFDSLPPEEQSAYRELTPAERKQYPRVRDVLEQEFSRDTRFSRDLELTANQHAQELEREFPTDRERVDTRPEDNLFNMGEAPENTGPEDEVREDDISSLAHAELEQHREIRDFMRRAAWEMPMLARLAKPFVPPAEIGEKGEEGVLRWRYTTYMGEMHPASRKVVVEFKPAELPGLERGMVDKLCKLAGTRYDVRSGKVKMSCESFETQAQNKRYLGDTVQALISEARDLSKDDFKDVPLDTRHLKQKKRYRFPEEWLLTEERKAMLEAKRNQILIDEGKKVEEDKIVGGIAAIEAARRFKLESVEEPVMAEARAPLPKGKMGQKQMGQQRVQRP